MGSEKEEKKFKKKKEKRKRNFFHSRKYPIIPDKSFLAK